MIHVPENAYRDAHITCANCQTAYANVFMVEKFISSTPDQALTIETLKDKIYEKHVDIDSAGRAQVKYQLARTEIPWYACDASLIPVLMPLCSLCQDKMTVTHDIINMICNFLASLSGESHLEQEVKFINSDHAFKIFRMQQRRFYTSAPYGSFINS